MRIVFFGTTHFSDVMLRALAESGQQLLAVVTQPPRPAGRGLQVRESPVQAAAGELGLRLETPADPNAPDFVGLVQALEPELFAVAAYGHIFGPGLLGVPSVGCVNVHPSLLPKYRGAAPIHHALVNGERETGITIIWMDERMDAGDIILQRALEIAPDDDAASLEAKLAGLGARALVEAIGLIEQDAAPRVRQEEARASYAPSLSRARGEINWSRQARRICDLVRGMTPAPGAYTFHRGKRLKVLRAQVEQERAAQEGKAGEIVETGARGVLVSAGQGAVLLTQVQPEGGRPMSGAEYARGHRPQPGERLG